MKFTHAWAEVSAQNVTLKVILVALSLTTVSLGFVALKLALRAPLLIERGCVTDTLIGQPDSGIHDRTEVEKFVRLALPERFDTGGSISAGFFSLQEEGFRAQEQKDLSSRGMIQRILINRVEVNGETVKIDADRLISVGQVRSALPFPIQVTLSHQKRSEANPYGLLIVNVTTQASSGQVTSGGAK